MARADSERWGNERIALEAEIASLRAALEEIRDATIDQYPTAHDLTEIARKALAEEEN